MKRYKHIPTGKIFEKYDQFFYGVKIIGSTHYEICTPATIVEDPNSKDWEPQTDQIIPPGIKSFKTLLSGVIAKQTTSYDEWVNWHLYQTPKSTIHSIKWNGEIWTVGDKVSYGSKEVEKIAQLSWHTTWCKKECTPFWMVTFENGGGRNIKALLKIIPSTSEPNWLERYIAVKAWATAMEEYTNWLRAVSILQDYRRSPQFIERSQQFTDAIEILKKKI